MDVKRIFDVSVFGVYQALEQNELKMSVPQPQRRKPFTAFVTNFNATRSIMNQQKTGRSKRVCTEDHKEIVAEESFAILKNYCNQVYNNYKYGETTLTKKIGRNVNVIKNNKVKLNIYDKKIK